MLKFIMSELGAYVAGLVAIVLALLAAWTKGKNAERNKQAKADIKGMKDAAQARDEIDSLDDDGVRDRARKRMRDAAKR